MRDRTEGHSHGLMRRAGREITERTFRSSPENALVTLPGELNRSYR